MKVLVVEDDQAALALLLEFLEMAGIVGRGAQSAAQAIAEIDLDLPDLLLSDWDLGGTQTGVDVADHLRSQAPDTPIVLITGREIDRLRQEAVGHNIVAYLRKPFSLHDLSAALQIGI